MEAPKYPVPSTGLRLEAVPAELAPPPTTAAPGEPRRPPVTGPDTAAVSAVSVAELLPRVERLASDNEYLRRQLFRSYHQLNVVFRITHELSQIGAPDALRDTLLAEFRDMLQARNVYTSRRAGEAQLAAGERAPDSDVVATELADEIRRVRETRRVTQPELSTRQRHALGAGHVLLGALDQSEEKPTVIIVIRDLEDAPFDTADMLAAETALVYGGHVFRNAEMVQRMRDMSFETVAVLANVIEARDAYTSGHSERVAWLSRRIGEHLNLPEAQLQTLEWSGLLHDIGKIGVSEDVLSKVGPLDAREFAEIKRHPELGYNVLRPVRSLAPVLDAVLLHHENHDGSGYPRGIAGDAIPLNARILHVADVFDALTSSRSYRDALSIDAAQTVMRAESGTVLDPALVDVLIQVLERAREEDPTEFAQRFAHVPDLSSAPQEV